MPFSNEFIKNRRIFNEKDLEIFLFYKDYGVNKTVSKYWTPGDIANNQNHWKQFETVPKQNNKQFTNSNERINQLIKKAVSEEVETVKKQFEDRKAELLSEIRQKEKVIKIKDDQTQRYELLKVEQEKEKNSGLKNMKKQMKKKGSGWKSSTEPGLIYFFSSYFFVYQ